ncbi:MAG: hypothetical protein K0R57_3805 [Paenibacillaceae bacterium]|nr:hypothetical protein [Paenibacillaceae bacterium]
MKAFGSVPPVKRPAGTDRLPGVTRLATTWGRQTPCAKRLSGIDRRTAKIQFFRLDKGKSASQPAKIQAFGVFGEERREKWGCCLYYCSLLSPWRGARQKRCIFAVCSPSSYPAHANFSPAPSPFSASTQTSLWYHPSVFSDKGKIIRWQGEPKKNLAVYFRQVLCQCCFMIRNASSAAAMVKSTSASVWATVRNQASYLDGARQTPRSSMRRKNWANCSPSVSWASA